MRCLPAPFLIIASLLVGCGESTSLATRTGAIGEVIVVMDDNLWAGAPGDAVRGALEQHVFGLPQREPKFNVVQFDHKGFTRMIFTHRNILITDIGPAFDTASVAKQPDRWSKEQMVIQVTAPDEASWLKAFNAQRERIATLYDQAERERLKAEILKLQDRALSDSISTHFNVLLTIPKDFTITKMDDHFVSLRRERIMSGAGLSHDVKDGLFIYQYPYVSDSTFTREYLMNMRDSVLKMYVEGPALDSYMITQRQFEHLDLRPSAARVDVNGQFGFEMRGLWGMEGAHMGGPFISLTLLDEARQMVITVEAYVYAPQFDKREFLRYLDAVLYSAKMAGPV